MNKTERTGDIEWIDIPRSFAAPSTWRYFDGASIIITGGTGSFGSAMARRLMQEAKPRRLVIFSRDELKQHDLKLTLQDVEHSDVLRFFIGDTRDAPRLEMAFRNVDYVIHAAAMKQVDTAEYNPFECIHTNVLGAENIVQASIKCGVKGVVALSTDKAANPINLYGASKLASDKIFVAANNLSGRDGPIFSVVRYGNVVGSRGSVVPLFQKMIREKAAYLPVTDERMTRFWITLDQGIDFVGSCFSLMRGGEIFIPRIPSMKVSDLAAAMAPDMEQKIVGMRPGEKLHEVMITENDWHFTYRLSDRYVIEPAFRFWDAGERTLIKNAERVPEGYVYSSDGNSEWLTRDALWKMIG